MNRNMNKTRCRVAFAALALSLAVAQPAAATNGYFANGYNPASQGMAGAGVAIDTGVMGMAINPALGFSNINRAEACLTLFAPDRDVTIGPGGPLTVGTFRSENTLFPIPCGGVNFSMGERGSLGFLIYANGGMNTEYRTNFFDPFTPAPATAPLGVNLEQLFINPTYSYRFSDQLTVGVGLVVAVQRFSATGLQDFAAFSTNPAALTNRGDSWSTGLGVNVGLLWQPSDELTFGAAIRSRIYMSEFDEYAGLFAEAGDFDIPPMATLGVAYTPRSTPNTTFTAEYQFIGYSSVAAVGNPLVVPFPALGATAGTGFGWNDMSVFRVGVESRVSDNWTIRGGVSYATEFSEPREVLLNTLAPATPQIHVSIGATYAIDDRREISMAYTRVMGESMTGGSPFTPQPVTLRMDQHVASVGMTWSW